MPQLSNKETGNILKNARNKAGLTQEEVAEKLGCSTRTIIRIENGEKTPTAREVLYLQALYKDPSLCDKYCSRECEIYNKYHPRRSPKYLSQISGEIVGITVPMLSPLSDLFEFIENASDSWIEPTDPEYVSVHDKLARLREAYKSLILWERWKELIRESKDSYSISEDEKTWNNTSFLLEARVTSKMSTQDVVTQLEPYIKGINKHKIEHYENGTTAVPPHVVVLLQEIYKDGTLCRRYCENVCPIGRTYCINASTEANLKHLTEITAEIHSCLDSLSRQGATFSDISINDDVEFEEKEDYEKIRKKLKRLARACESLEAWIGRNFTDKDLLK